jgi:hypothetical protein
MPNPETDGGDLERERLELKREKSRAEDSARRDELGLKRDELKRSRWVNPLVIAIFAATVAALGNAAVTLVSSYQQAQLETEKVNLNKDLEQTKSEAARILEIVKTGDSDKAAVNLQFLIDVGLISDKEGRIQTYLVKREPGKGVSLPTAGAESNAIKPLYDISGRLSQPDGGQMDIVQEAALVLWTHSNEKFWHPMKGTYRSPTEIAGSPVPKYGWTKQINVRPYLI